MTLVYGIMVPAAVGLSDGVGMDDVIAFSAGGIVVLTFVLTVGKLPFWRSLRRSWAWFQKFQDDWDGVAGDAGHARIPGMMEWRRSIDAELKTNGGTSMKDALVKAVVAAQENGKAIKLVDEKVDAVRETVESMVSPTGGGVDNRINPEPGGSK